MVAFARLVNYVRFFHPSDEAMDANWGEFVIRTLPRVEQARDSSELAAVLQEAIASVGPTVSVYPSFGPPSGGRFADLSGAAVAAWMHRGVVTSETIDVRGPYSSERVTVPTDGEWPDWFPDPSDPLVVDLDAGVSASIPLAVYVTDGASVPAASDPNAPWLRSAIPLTTYGDYPQEARETKQAAVILTWGYFQHFYPYWNVVDTDWAAALNDALMTIVQQPDIDLGLLLRRLVAQAHDGHATVSTGASQDLATPPIRWQWIEGQVVITNVTGSAPPDVVIGSVVTHIDGQEAASVVERIGHLVPAASPQRRRLEALIAILEGPWGSTLKLTIRTPGGETTDVDVKRTAQRVWRGVPPIEPRPEPITEIAAGVGYLDLTRARLSDDQLELLDSFDNLIVDVRGYPTEDGFEIFAHLLDAPAKTDRLLVPITTRPDGVNRTYEDEAWWMQPEFPQLASQIVFLADERAQSSPETLLGMVQDNGIGDIVGTPTAGTNGNIIRFITPGGYRIVFTAMKVTDSDGTIHHGIGVLPTVPVNRTITGVADGRDELLDAAVALLLG